MSTEPLKSTLESVYSADPPVADSGSAQVSGSELRNAANEFATKVMVKLAEAFPDLLNDFLTRLVVETQDDDAHVESVKADQAVSAATGEENQHDPLWSDIESLFADGSNEPIIVKDTQRSDNSISDELNQKLCQAGIRSVLFLPLIGRGDLRGVLILTRNDRSGDWSEATVDELTEVSTVVGSVLAHRRIEGLLEGALRGNRRLSQQLVEIQEQEQRRLAQELHDETGQYLAALMSDAALIGRRIPDGDDILRRSAEAIVTTAEHIYEVVYGVMGRLCAVDLDDLGLDGALQACVTNSGLENKGIKCTLVTTGDLDSLDDTINMTVYRFVQECLTNISKYANATAVNISVERVVRTYEDRRHRYRDRSATSGSQPADRIHVDTLEITVEDNGIGMQEGQSEQGGGFGIRGMRERMQALGGNLTVESEPGAGVRVHGVLSLAASQKRSFSHD